MLSIKKPLLIALVTAVVAVLGCAEERDPRSYVQPHVLSKADFTGEWYYIPTVVDVPFTTTVTFIGETSMDVAIIRWDIQENHIFARLAYDRIDGAETGTHEIWEGEIIGAWAIKHFDIIRDYNATTGEEINVIRESTERPWYEREFIRVNWTKNLATNWAMFWPHFITVDSIGYSSTDPSDPTYPKYVRTAEGELNYIGVTDKVNMAPEMRDIEFDFMGLSEIPDCFFYGTTTSCNASTIMVRHAFWKKNPDNEYEPRKYEQTEMDRFGYFLTNVLNYNREYGILIQDFTQYANRWNFFKESFKKATSSTIAESYADRNNHVAVDGIYTTCPGGDEPCRYLDDNTKVYIMGYVAYDDSDVSADDRGSVFCPGSDDRDAYGRRKPCFWEEDGMTYIAPDSNWWQDPTDAVPVTLRYTDRELRPLIYYLNKSFPKNLWGINQDGSVDLNQPAEGSALKRTIDEWANAHNTWLDFLGVRRNANAAVMVCPYIPADYNGEPVYAYGSRGTIECERDVRRGDFRHPSLNWVDEAQQSSPLGYGPPLPDPRTGESISVVANIYGEALDGYVAYQRDIVRMLTDPDFPWDQYLRGDYQASWTALTHNQMHKNGNLVEPRMAALPWMRENRVTPKSRIKQLFNNMSTGWASGLAPEARLDTSSHKAFRASLKKRIKAISLSGALGDGTGTYAGYAKLNLLRDTPIEDKLMTSEVMMLNGDAIQAAGLDPLLATSADLPYGSQTRAKVSPLTTLNVRYLRALERVKDLHRKNTVMYPMTPYFDENAIGVAKMFVETYCGGTWQGEKRWGECSKKIYDYLREETFIGVTVHEMGHNMGLRHNFKGTYDAMNFFDPYWELRNDGSMGPRTSDKMTEAERVGRINDYAYTSIMDYNGNWNGDFFGLGKYDKAAINYAYGGMRQVFKTVTNQERIADMQRFSEWSYPSPLVFGQTISSLHYTQFPSYAPLSDDNREWVPNAWITQFTVGNFDVSATRTDHEPGSTNRYMVPYMFCSDDFRNLALGCNLFDQGADLYEITQYLINAYERNYVLNNFSRGSYTWGWNSNRYQRRIISRYFDILQNHVQYYMLWLGIFYDNFEVALGRAGVEEFFSDDVNGWGSWTLAVADIFSTFIRVLTMPQPGFFKTVTDERGTYYKFDTERTEYADDTTNFVPLIAGKFIDDIYDYDWGYEWYLKILRRGQFFDRPLAIQMIAEATNNWLGRDTQEDFRKYTMNFERIYPDQIAAVFTGIQNNNFHVVAPRVCGKAVDTVTDTTYMAISYPYAAALATDETARDAQCAAEYPTISGGGASYIDPNNTFSIQLYAATMGMALFPMNYSQEFIDVSRIYVLGEGEGIDWSGVTDPSRVKTFVDPYSDKVFTAISYPDRVLGDGTLVNVSLAASMIEEANKRKTEFETAEADYIAAGGTPQSAPDAYTAYKTAERLLKNYIDNLEMVRGLTRTFEFAEFSAP